MDIPCGETESRRTPDGHERDHRRRAIRYAPQEESLCGTKAARIRLRKQDLARRLQAQRDREADKRPKSADVRKAAADKRRAPRAITHHARSHNVFTACEVWFPPTGADLICSD